MKDVAHGNADRRPATGRPRKPDIALFNALSVGADPSMESLYAEFRDDPDVQELCDDIYQRGEALSRKWKIAQRQQELSSRDWRFENATAGTPYNHTINAADWGLSDIEITEIRALDGTELLFDPQTLTLSGRPTAPGTKHCLVIGRLTGSHGEDAAFEKRVDLVVNPDPRSLWKDHPPPENAPYPKANTEAAVATLGDRMSVYASKRGRAHAHKGTFRDDHCEVRHFDKAGWSVVAVADGAGSAPLSREGSRIACRSVVDFFANIFDDSRQEAHVAEDPASQLEPVSKPRDVMKWADDHFAGLDVPPTDSDMNTLKTELKTKLLYPATRQAFDRLEASAKQAKLTAPDLFTGKMEKNPLLALNTTLVFCLFKKFRFGYLHMSFSVGDCPAVIISQDARNMKLLNTLDVGEFGGGTRFLTQHQIFDPKRAEIPMQARFDVGYVLDFSFMFLMTDGIYDPKFEVEANLEDINKWHDFIDDLAGKNEFRNKVEFTADNPDLSAQLLDWMDFFSRGNHDDRTLAVVF